MNPITKSASIQLVHTHALSNKFQWEIQINSKTLFLVAYGNVRKANIFVCIYTQKHTQNLNYKLIVTPETGTTKKYTILTV